MKVRPKDIVTHVFLLALLAFGATSVRAELVGTLNPGESWNLHFQGSGPVQPLAITVTSIDSRGRLQTEVFTIAISSFENTLLYDNVRIGSSVRRIIIDLDFPIFVNTAVIMSIWQGPVRPSQPPWVLDLVSETSPSRLVFNVAAAQ